MWIIDLSLYAIFTWNDLTQLLPLLSELHVPSAYRFIRIPLVSWDYEYVPQGTYAALHWLCS